jgi:hypothetical protein
MRAFLRRGIAWSVPWMALALTLGPAAHANSAPRSVPANVDISVKHANEAEDAIAVNPTNPQNIVAMSTLADAVSGLFEGVSFDGGNTWTRQVIGAGGDLGEICCDQQLAWDPSGNLWMVYLLNDSGNVPIAVSIDGGLTFTKVAEIVPTTPKGSKALKGAAVKRLADREQTKGTASGDQPSISAGPHSVWVSYTSYPSLKVQASGVSITGLGQYGDFTPPETVPTSRGRGNFGDTAVGPNDEVMVIYQDQTNGQGGSRIYTAIDPDGFGPAGFTDPRFLSRSRVGGFDYVPVQPNRSVDAEANLAWHGSVGPHPGRVYAIWTQEVKNESDNMDIMFQRSDDDGATWSDAVRLNDDQGTNSQVNPAIAVDQATGDVAASWYDARNDLGDGGPGDTDGVPNDDLQIWATYSTDGGVTLARSFQVSQGTSSADAAGSYFDYGDYTHAAFQEHTFYPAWSDNSNSTGENPDGTLHEFDLYMARVRIP